MTAPNSPVRVGVVDAAASDVSAPTDGPDRPNVLCDLCDEVLDDEPVKFGDGVYCSTFCMELGNEWREDAS